MSDLDSLGLPLGFREFNQMLDLDYSLEGPEWLSEAIEQDKQGNPTSSPIKALREPLRDDYANTVNHIHSCYVHLCNTVVQ